jgi:hypothetical protein
MAALVVLAGLAFAGVALFVMVAVFGLILRTAIRLVLLPLFLIKWIVMGVLMLIVGPILFVAGVIAFLALGLAVAIPLLPILAVVALVWLLVRASRHPAVA